MSGVIKAGDRTFADVVAAFEGGALPAAPGQAAMAVREDPVAAELGRLRGLIEARDEEIADLEAAVKTARAEGVEAGRAAMELEFEDDRAKALDKLGKGIEDAQASLTEFYERLEVLSLLVARTALERLFGSDGAREEAVIDLVRKQLARLERQSLVAIEVSRLDFPDTGEVADLVKRLGVEPGHVTVNDALDAGACRMRLKLGTIEAGLDQQWGAVRELLTSLAGDALAFGGELDT